MHDVKPLLFDIKPAINNGRQLHLLTGLGVLNRSHKTGPQQLSPIGKRRGCANQLKHCKGVVALTYSNGRGLAREPFFSKSLELPVR